MLANILIIGLVIVLLWSSRPIWRVKEYNEEYLSMSTTKAWKGIFALVVLFHHMSLITVDNSYFQCFNRVGFLAVAVFFFFSGYGVQKKYMSSPDYKNGFLLKRLPVVLVPYIIITAIYWLIYASIGTRYTIKDIIINIFIGKPIVSFSWYIIDILIFYVVFYILMMICKNHYWVMILGGFIYCIMWMIFCQKMKYGEWWYNTNILLIIGMLWAVWEKQLKSVFEKCYILIAPMATITFLWMFVSLNRIVQNVSQVASGVKTILAIIFVLCVIMFSMKVRIGNIVLMYFGEISLEIYLIQGFFIIEVCSESVQFSNNLLCYLFGIAVTIFWAKILHIFFKRIMSK